MSEIMNELTAEPVQFTKTALIVRTWFLLSLYSSLARSGSSWSHSISSYMLKGTLVSFVACAIFLKETTRRDLVRIVDVKKFTVITLLALVWEPMYADSPLPLAFIDPLILRFQNCIQLVSASDLNRSRASPPMVHVGVGHRHISIGGGPGCRLSVGHHWHHALIILGKIIVAVVGHD